MILLRKLQEPDVPFITQLLNELGYPVDQMHVSNQMKKVLSHPEHDAYVALDDEIVVGYIHGVESIRLTTEPFLEIIALVVGKKYRKQGIGRKLVQHLENNTTHLNSVRVRCNLKREIAHKFYKALNFDEMKKQVVFTKGLQMPNAN